MADEIRILRTTSNAAPEYLGFGELAFSEGTKTLYVGLSDGTPFPLLGGQSQPHTAWSLANFQIRASTGSNGGILVNDQWVYRELNYHSGDFGQLTAAGLLIPSGQYYVTGWAISLEAGSSRIRLRAPDADIEIYGASLFSNHYALPNLIEGSFEVAQETIFRLEQRCSRNESATWRRRNWMLGYRTNFDAAPEIYASLTFLRR